MSAESPRVSPVETSVNMGLDMSPENVAALVEKLHAHDYSDVNSSGGVDKVLRGLGSGLEEGIPASSATERGAVYGINKFADPPTSTVLEKIWDTLQDPTLIMLLVAAFASIAIGATLEADENGWVDGVAILVAVALVTGVTVWNDVEKEAQFRVLNEVKNETKVKAIRGGELQTIWTSEVVVGDVMVLEAGDKVCADGIYLKGYHIKADESALTGESLDVNKNEEEVLMRSGSRITEGSDCRMLVLAVGENSQWGQIMATLNEEAEDTPLQEKLAELAQNIGFLGIFVATICFIVMTIAWSINVGDANRIGDVLKFFLFAITIVVVAVPEGLPLAVTISLAYSMRKMMVDQNFVRHLAACETMGSATVICSDKTGTLTTNRMTVMMGWFCGKKYESAQGVKGQVTLSDMSALPALGLEELSNCMAINSRAFISVNDHGIVEYVGNKSECATLVFLDDALGRSYKSIRLSVEDEDPRKLWPFDSGRKMMSALSRHPSDATAYVLYSKGAPEIILKKCSSYMDASGAVVPLDDAKKQSIIAEQESMATVGLRTLLFAFKNFGAGSHTPEDSKWDSLEEEDLCVLGVVGIKDPVREGVPENIEVCTGAGVAVKMVTGDNKLTAEHIARECGILLDDDNVAETVIEGPAFRALSEEKRAQVAPGIKVMARSSPNDKLLMVAALKSLGEIVGVTGDGTNDAPALKEADVGLSMGLAGTEVAKEASDIVILDDSFNSIVKAILWGRSVFNNIRKFLQFQLTVNVVALSLAFFAAVISALSSTPESSNEEHSEESELRSMPLNVIQLLWVNLIMDSLGALALATENPTPDLLERRPQGRSEPLITPKMYKHIGVQSIYQFVWLMLILYVGPELAEYNLSKSDSALRLNSIVFNTFIFCQLFNEINSRKINDEINILSGIADSPIFAIVLTVTLLFQILFIEVAYEFFKVTPLNWQEWLFSIGVGAFSWVPSAIAKLPIVGGGPEKYVPHVIGSKASAGKNV